MPADKPEFLAGCRVSPAGHRTGNSGFATGSDARKYQETCPVEVQQELRHGYVAGLDAAVPDLEPWIAELTVKVARTGSRLGNITSRMQSLRRLQSAARKQGNEASVEFCGAQLSPSTSRKWSVVSALRSAETALPSALEKRTAIDERSLR